MKKRSIIILGLAILAFVLLTAALLPSADLVRFKVNNESDGDVYISLSGGSSPYYLRHQANTDYVWTVMPGVYEYSIYVCSVYKYGTVDLTQQSTWDIPDCGEKAYAESKGKLGTDIGGVLQLKRTTLVNETSQTYLIVSVYGEGNSWVFTLVKDVMQQYTLPKGVYTYRAYGCGGSWTGTLDVAKQNTKLAFTCP